MSNKETSIGIKLLTDLRNYQDGMRKASKETKDFAGNVKKGMGDVKGAFQGLLSGDLTQLPNIFKSASTASEGFAKGLNGVKVALISTGIGALIVGLGTAVAALTTYFKRSEEGQIAFMEVMNKIKAYTEPIIQMFGRFGKAIFELFKGDFKGAWETAKGAVNGVGDAIKNNVENLGALNEAQKKFIVENDELANKSARLQAEISDLREKAADEENYNVKQRASYINQAMVKQREYGELQKQIVQNELEFKKLKAAQGDATIEMTTKIKDLENRIFEVQNEQSKALKKIGSQKQTINKELEKQIAYENEIKRIETEQAALKANPLEKMTSRGVRVEATDKSSLPSDQLAAIGGSAETAANSMEKLNENYQEFNNNVVSTISEMGNSFQILGDAIGGTAGSWVSFAGKVLQSIPELIAQISALTVVKEKDSVAGATQAAASLPFPLNIISVAASVASVIAALSTSVPKMAKGGLVYGPTTALVGEYAGASSNPEVISPLSKLKDMIGGANQNITVEVVGSISGDNIRLSQKRAERKRNQFN